MLWKSWPSVTQSNTPVASCVGLPGRVEFLWTRAARKMCRVSLTRGETVANTESYCIRTKRKYVEIRDESHCQWPTQRVPVNFHSWLRG